MNIAKNYLYNLSYQVFVLLVPLITIPYISRILGSEGVGINAFTLSIVQYFVLAGSIGISMYGNRKIAYVKDNREELEKTFWSIFWLKVITTGIAFIAFVVFLFVVDRYRTIYVFQSIYIFAAMLDITWLYIGLEDFRKTVIRNLIVKIISTVAVFVFIHEATDLWKYVLLLALSQFVGNATMYAYLPKTVSYIKVSFIEIFSHLKPTLALFIPQIALQIYLVLNKTMLGIFGNAHQVGVFDNSDKIIKLILTIVTAMGTVMLPRVANTFAKGDMKQVNEYLYSSFKFASYTAIPLMFGLAAIASNFVPWFFGSDFVDAILVITVLSPIILWIAWSNVFGTQYLLAINKTSLFTISVTVGAIVNFILNFFFIPKYYAVGAAIATLIAEFAVTLTQFILIRQDIRPKRLFSGIWKFLISGFTMFVGTFYVGTLIDAKILATIIQIVVGIIIYAIILYLLKSDIHLKVVTFIFKFVKKIKKKVVKL